MIKKGFQRILNIDEDSYKISIERITKFNFCIEITLEKLKWTNSFYYEELKFINKNWNIFENEEIFYFLKECIIENCFELILNRREIIILYIWNKVITGKSEKLINYYLHLNSNIESKEINNKDIIRQLKISYAELDKLKESLEINHKSFINKDLIFNKEISKLNKISKFYISNNFQNKIIKLQNHIYNNNELINQLCSILNHHKEKSCFMFEAIVKKLNEKNKLIILLCDENLY